MNMKALEQKVDLLMDYVTCPESDIERKESLLLELRDLKSQVKVVNEKTVKSLTENILTELGIPTNLLGYKYITSSVRYIIENPGRNFGMVKELYPAVADEYSIIGGASRVERGIRHAIETCFDRAEPEVLTKYFGRTVSFSRGKATNSEFLYRLAQLVEREMEE